MGDPREVLLAASALLTYPDDVLATREAYVREAARSFSRSARQHFEEFQRHVQRVGLWALQQEYVETFDLQGGVPLYLTPPTLKDDRERGFALVELKRRYRAGGLQPSSTELPDFLPMFLEFMGLAERTAGRSLGSQYLATVEGLASQLHRRRSAYAPLLDASVAALRSLVGPLPHRRATE